MDDVRKVQDLVTQAKELNRRLDEMLARGLQSSYVWVLQDGWGEIDSAWLSKPAARAYAKQHLDGHSITMYKIRGNMSTGDELYVVYEGHGDVPKPEAHMKVAKRKEAAKAMCREMDGGAYCKVLVH